MRIAGEGERLEGRIEMDDAYLGGERRAARRAAAAPARSRLSWRFRPLMTGDHGASSCGASPASSAKRVKTLTKQDHRRTDATVVTDGLKCFRGVADAGCKHVPMTTGSGRRSARHPAFKWVNTMLGNIKTSIAGTYRAIRKKHMVRYLAEFEWRFNHRFDLAAMIPVLGHAAVRTRPATYGDLKWADYGA